MRKTLSWLLYGIFLLAIGIAGYVYFTSDRLFDVSPHRIVSAATMTGSIALLIESFVRPRPPRSARVISRRSWNLANRISVLVITALVAIGIAFTGDSSSGLWGVVLALILGGGAFALARVVRRHGEEIGEARSDTSNPEGRRDDPPTIVDA